MATEDLDSLRGDIEKLDDILLQLLLWRLRLALRIEETKRARKKPIRCPEREREELDRILDQIGESESPLARLFIAGVVQAIFNQSVRAQKQQLEDDEGYT